MPELIHRASGRRVPLPSRALVGRSSACYLQLDESHVSGEHAVLVWEGGAWSLRDLGSRNGTFLGGERVGPGEAKRLEAGARLAFGKQDDLWSLSSVAAPEAVAVNLEDRSAVSAVEGLLVLPAEDRPEVSIFLSAEGFWVVEDDRGDRRTLRDQSLVDAGGARWMLLLPGPSEATPALGASMSLASAQIVFRVSRDQEHVELSIEGPQGRVDLGRREHHFVLMVMARARLEDAELPVEERGWLDRDELLKMLGMDVGGLGVAIHRARRALAREGLLGANEIVEVRRGQRRFGTDRVRIEQP